MCDECPRARKVKAITAFRRIQDIAPVDPSLCILEQGVPCNGPATRSGCTARCPQAGTQCIGCYGPAEGVLDYGARLMTAFASVIDAREPEEIERILDGIPDPVGQIYRFNLAGSLLRASQGAFKKKDPILFDKKFHYIILMLKSSPHKAVALLSGGLDSMLAILAILRQGIRVSAIRFSTPFDAHTAHDEVHGMPLERFSQQRDFDITMLHLGTEMIDIVKNPAHGHGKNMNPCIDCRIMMLKHARQFMEMVGADFLLTGEVL